MAKVFVFSFLLVVSQLSFASGKAVKGHQSYKACDSTTTCGKGETCFDLVGLKLSTSVCLPDDEACKMVCGKKKCLIQESHPAQISCQK